MSHPSRLGKYEITELLGEGAMGVVYKAFDPDIRRVVALKTIRSQLTDGSDFAQSISARFRNEAQAAGRLAHPGIVGVYDYGEDGPIAFISMEYVEGRSIASYLASQVRFTDEDIPGLMSQLLDALQHAHAQGVWHRDIKPANVILSRGGTLKIADFGIARVDAGGLTQANTMIGTPAYMAPEQFIGGDVDARADIYSAGVLLYVLLTGRPPFSGTPDALMYKVVHEQPLPPSTVEGALRPSFYNDIVVTALAKDANSRYQSAHAFKAAMTEAIGRPFDTSAWEKTIIKAPSVPSTAVPLANRSASGSSLGTTAARQWDRAMLAEAEQSLAHYVGPLATVLVRRAARECDNAPALFAKLAEQVTDPTARQAFLGRVQASATYVAEVSSPSLKSSAGFGDAFLARAKALLAKEVGPIAGIVVKKAAAASRDRSSFLAILGESVANADARARLISELEHLP